MNAATLLDQVKALKAEVAALRVDLEASKIENTLLRQKLDMLARRYFGKQTEQLDPGQLQLLLSGVLPDPTQAPAAAAEGPVRAVRQSRPRTGRQRLRTPDDLEVVSETIEPELVRAEPDQWKRIGEETSRLLDYQPGKFFWRETVRPKYVRRDRRLSPPVVAAAPARVAGHCQAAPGLLAQLLVGKYADHLPFYRQETIYWQRHGVYISRQQMVMWTGQAVGLLEAVSLCLKKELQGAGYVQLDETPVRYLDADLEGRSGQGYLWVGLVPGKCVVYEWHASRAAGCLESLLGPDFKGKLQCDGYSAYPTFAKGRPEVELFGCLAHARRKFFEAKEQAPKAAGWVLGQIALLYRWEEELRRNRAGPAAREARRGSHGRMVMTRLRRALEKIRPRHLPRSLMGEAISYALGHWPVLEKFLDHGEVEIDNNLVENAIRPTAVGKKNWLFFGSEEAGRRNAVIYTLIANCKMHGVEPRAYLKDLLERLPTMTIQEVTTLTPLNWKKSRQARLRIAA